MAIVKLVPPVIRIGEYLVKKKFGTDAQSRTFLAEKEEMSDKFFTLKLVNYYTEEEQQQAEKEIDQMKSLKSPYTVNLICTFTRDIDMCLVFEFCERGDLRDEIVELQKLPIKERVMSVWEIFAQMALAVNHLHSHDVIHCGIKPENIFVIADRSVKMGDFGIQKVLIDQSYAKIIVGTKPYMAPEVFTKKRMDKQSDMYSLGIVVFELLTGKHPFAADSEQAMIDKIRKNEVAKLPEQVPKDLANFVMRMMNPDECSRPPIQEILDNSTIQMYIRQHNSKSKSILLELDEKVRIADERTRLAEEHIRQTEEKARSTEEQTRISAQKEHARVDQEKVRTAQEHALVIAQQTAKQSQIPAQLNSVLLKMNIPEDDQSRVEGSAFICQNGGKSFDCSTITMDPIQNQGIVRFEVVFNGHYGEEFSLGIVEASQIFKKNYLPIGNENGDYSARYSNNGNLEHRRYNVSSNSTYIKGNSPFKCGQRVSIEADMTQNPKRAVFFVDGVEQKNSVVNIPEYIRFYVFVSLHNSSFRVTRFEKLPVSSARGVPGSKQWEWGKDWIRQK
ncbi:MAG: putative serine/threonine-protein kinase Nek3 [Streblomastix strix]|uniref:non-specific serine/threonine protein kinase n=1 Tax=Streblomastix strix TaxID=222440 RepID=A0A5J4WSI3_9EUKA|nr:MAG: putative serine/threonine-protein kinase Nek3 [Streblomastix strix]